MELLLRMHRLYTLVSQNLLIDYLSYMFIMTSDLYADSTHESVFSLEVRWVSCGTKTSIFFHPCVDTKLFHTLNSVGQGFTWRGWQVAINDTDDFYREWVRISMWFWFHAILKTKFYLESLIINDMG